MLLEGMLGEVLPLLPLLLALSLQVNPENPAFNAGKYPLLLPKQLGQAHQLEKKNLLLDLLAQMLLPMMLLVLMVMGMDLRLEQGRAMTAMTLLPLLSLPLLLMVGKQGKLVLLPMFLPLLMDMLERKNLLI